MSTFRGTLVEYERVSIDRFDGGNVNSTAFFLSHCHRDHMQGLSGKAFRNLLRSRRDVKLYASQVSCRLLVNEPKYAWLRRHLSALPLSAPRTLAVPTDGQCANGYDLVVTAISADHCAGSVMFLFEGRRGNVLYTGDFRFDVGHAQTLAPLHYDDGSVKPIRAAYVDTTLCHRDAAYVPTRGESEAALVAFFEPKFKSGVRLRLALPGAQLGYETLLESLSLAFGVKVHVTKRQLSRYAGIADVLDAVTTEALGTPIHADCYCDLGENCVTVKPSAMWFAHRVAPSLLMERVGDDFYRLCYSTHASLAEVRDLVRYLKPQAVRANVRVRGLDISALLGGTHEEAEDPVWSFWSSEDEDDDGVHSEAACKVESLVDAKVVLSSGTKATPPSSLLRSALRPLPYQVSKLLDDLL
uniref:Protein artemis n=1 Tax=Amblyomma sculptum TaxID=1581419 RepID=A0A1E1XLK3_AMBSC